MPPSQPPIPRQRAGSSPDTGRRHRRSWRSVASWGLLRPLVPGRPFLEAEVAWAAREEMAVSVDDVLSRRLRLSPELADRGATVAPRVAAILGAELGWDDDRQAAEAAGYLATARREFGVAERRLSGLAIRVRP